MGGEVRKADDVIMVCRCNDVTVDEIREAIEMGIDDFELLRKYLRLGFGPCQGRSCIMIAARLFARVTGRRMEEVLLDYKVRPPIVPIPAGHFARGTKP